MTRSVAKSAILLLCVATSVVAAALALLHQKHPGSSPPSTRATTATTLSRPHAVAAATHYARLVWSDEFNGRAGAAPSASAWNHDIGAYGSPDGELQTYTASPVNASLDGHGSLAIVAMRQTVTGPDHLMRRYTSARLQTQGLFSVKYGLIEARMKVPAGAGLWSAFWMLGNGFSTVGWPRCGELDVAEILGGRPSVARGTIHGPTERSGNASRRSGYSSGADSDADSSLALAFHVYAVSWSPDSITWMLDGKPWSTVTAADLATGQRWVFNQPFHLLLSLAVGGDWAGTPTSSTPFPATLLVDWVRVYQR